MMIIYKIKITNKLLKDYFIAEVGLQPGDDIRKKMKDIAREYAEDLKTVRKNIQVKIMSACTAA